MGEMREFSHFSFDFRFFLVLFPVDEDAMGPRLHAGSALLNMAASETGEHAHHIQKSPAAAQKPPNLRALEVKTLLLLVFYPFGFFLYS